METNESREDFLKGENALLNRKVALYLCYVTMTHKVTVKAWLENFCSFEMKKTLRYHTLFYSYRRFIALSGILEVPFKPSEIPYAYNFYTTFTLYLEGRFYGSEN
jgi:hypothetical protein